MVEIRSNSNGVHLILADALAELRRVLPEPTGIPEDLGRVALENYDPLGCSVVFHCDHSEEEYVTGWVQRDPLMDTWCMTITFNGYVMGLTKEIEQCDISGSFVIGHLGYFVRLLEMGGIFDPVDTYEFSSLAASLNVDFTEDHGDLESDTLREWVEDRLRGVGGPQRVLDFYNELRIMAVAGGRGGGNRGWDGTNPEDAN